MELPRARAAAVAARRSGWPGRRGLGVEAVAVPVVEGAGDVQVDGRGGPSRRVAILQEEERVAVHKLYTPRR